MVVILLRQHDSQLINANGDLTINVNDDNEGLEQQMSMTFWGKSHTANTFSNKRICAILR